MDNGSLYTTVETFTRIILPPLYLLAGLIVFRWFLPHLSPTSRRLAIFMLVAQVLAIGKTIYLEPSSSFDAWLWDLHKEWNIPATLASTQLALAGGVALLTAWLARARPAWHRFYLVGIGLVFLFLAYDEYFTLHEYWASWDYIVLLGVVVVAATLVVAARSPRQSWKWHLCLLAGLAISAAGAIQIEQFGSVCGDYGLLYIDDCPSNTVWALEEIFEFLGIWLTLVATLGHLSALSPSPAPRVRRALIVFPALWIVLLIQSAAMQPIARQIPFRQSADVQFELGERLHAYRIEQGKSGLGCHLFLSPRGWEYEGVGYSIFLFDQLSETVVAGLDTYAHHRLDFNLAPGYMPVYRQWKQLEFPPNAPTNRALWIVLTLWREQDGEFIRQRVIDSDHRLLSETQVILSELVIPGESTMAATEPAAVFENGFTLDAVTLPETAQAGETLAIDFTWRSDIQGSEDHVQFLHLGHAESGEWWVYDQQPLGARLPTRLWYDGLADSESWQVPLPADLAPGEYSVFTGLYRASDKERVPVNDADGLPWLDNRVALGSLTING